MRAVLQKVSAASVTVDGQVVGAITGPGILVLVGVQTGDGLSDATYIADKITGLRIFDGADENAPEQSLSDVGGSVLVVSQFTLLGDCRKGRRPSWSEAAPPDEARKWYETVVLLLQQKNLPVQTGVFRAHMHVTLTNDGPITLLLDSRIR